MNTLAIMAIGIAIWVILEILVYYGKSARAIRRRQFIATEVVCALIVMNTDGTIPKVAVAIIMQFFAVAISLFVGYVFIADHIKEDCDEDDKYVEVFALVPFGRERAVSKKAVTDARDMMAAITIVLLFTMMIVREILIFPDFGGHAWTFAGLLIMLITECVYAGKNFGENFLLALLISVPVFGLTCITCWAVYDVMDTAGFDESEYQTETVEKELLPLNQCFYELPDDLPDLSFGVRTKREKLEDDVYLLYWLVQSGDEEKLKYCYSTNNNEHAQERSGDSVEVYCDDDAAPRVVEITKYVYGRYSNERRDIETKCYIYIPQKNVKSLR